jgi:o-succinylbenzoate synthase
MTIKRVEELLLMGPVVIDRIDAVRLSIPMIEPFRISSGEVSCKEAIVIRMQNSRSFGWGESSAMPGAFYSQDTPDSCQRQLVDDALPKLAGSRFQTIGDLEAALRAWNLSPFVRVAIETAAWEMLARTGKQTLRQIFGLPDKPASTGLAVGLYPTLDELHAALERYRVLDYSRLKIKIKRGHDIALVQAVRRWYGDFPLYVDANADYSEEHIEIFRELDNYNLMMFEQPFARENIETSMKLQRQVRTPICFDEGIETVDDVHQASILDACRIVNIKLQRVGGYLEAIRIAEACVHRRLPFWMGTMPELGVGSAQALVLASHPGCSFPTDVEPSTRWYLDDILEPELRMHEGYLTIPAGAGLGFSVNEGRIDRYAVKRWSF